MSYEVEIKFHAPDHGAIARKLGALGAAEGETVDQEDIYLAHPARDFAQTDEALRLRRIGRENRVTYKGPKLGGPTKTREEIELPLKAGREALEQYKRLFERLGFRPVAAIRKIRRPFRLERGGRTLEVVLDRAERLGDFAEVEAVAVGSEDLPGAQAAVLELAGVLGLEHVERRSYLRMWLESQADSGNPPGPA